MWIRIDKTHPLLKNDGKGGPTEPETALARRIYGWNGELWPRFLLSIHSWTGRYPDYQIEGITVDYSINKDKRHPWWDHHSSLPLELVPEMIEMLQEAQRKLQETNHGG